jgi:hypothetical protein
MENWGKLRERHQSQRLFVGLAQVSCTQSRIGAVRDEKKKGHRDDMRKSDDDLLKKIKTPGLSPLHQPPSAPTFVCTMPMRCARSLDKMASMSTVRPSWKSASPISIMMSTPERPIPALQCTRSGIGLTSRDFKFSMSRRYAMISSVPAGTPRSCAERRGEKMAKSATDEEG